ncbi:lipase 3-like [Battus philenor]|uniref:lipase 3-like n=1 Tax=Battus philenor TaxID=42288 RepID=UPI0035D0C9DA
MITSRSEILFGCTFFFISLSTACREKTPTAGNGTNRNFARAVSSNFTTIAARYGYVSEEHTVMTDDGYILTMFRIPRGKACRSSMKPPPVLLMHGLLQSADSWVDAGPSSGLAFLISDACYDLWVGNVRGTYYSRRHVRLDPDLDAEFWKFSTHEMGILDLPAIFDYVLTRTKSDDLMYLGFSQGSRIFFTMCSDTSGYCDKARISIHIAPAAIVTNTRSISVRALVEGYAVIAPSLSSPVTLEVLPKGGLVQKIVSTLCRKTLFAATVCKLILTVIDSYDPGSVTTETASVLYDHFPAGTSASTLAIYGQNIISGRFQRYDYGLTENLKIYGTAQPTPYDLNRISTPVVLIYGNNDFVVNPLDVKLLSTQIPNVLETYEVSRPEWNHLDNTYSRYTKQQIFPKINEYLQKYSKV